MNELGPFHQLALIYHTDLVGFWGEADVKWLTAKAKINELIKIISRKYRIERFVFKKENKEEFKKAMERALKQGYWPGLRSCYFYQPLGKAPWIMALKSRRAIRLFFKKRKKNQRKLWLGTPAHYDEWLADPGLKEVVVMFNPERLSPQFAKEHFVARIEIFENNLRIKMKLNTDQLREIEGSAERGDLIILKMRPRDTFRFEKGPVIASFGRQYLKRGVRLPEKKTIEMFNGAFGEFKAKNSQYKKLVNPYALSLASQVTKIVFNDWCG
ncbi:hypothetical protein KKI19_03770, partial [Patescibacteria group bacterium]|nr:hypothetical protein [Patescibacteria group bacterium]